MAAVALRRTATDPVDTVLPYLTCTAALSTDLAARGARPFAGLSACCRRDTLPRGVAKVIGRSARAGAAAAVATAMRSVTGRLADAHVGQAAGPCAAAARFAADFAANAAGVGTGVVAAILGSAFPGGRTDVARRTATLAPATVNDAAERFAERHTGRCSTRSEGCGDRRCSEQEPCCRELQAAPIACSALKDNHHGRLDLKFA